MNSNFNPDLPEYSETYQTVSLKKAKGEKIDFIENYREGFIFGGWEYMSHTEKGDFIWNFGGHVITGTTVLLPIWIPIYEDIYTKEDLINIGQDKENLSKNYQLKNDIDLDGEEWIPIGDDNSPFLGHFNGNGYKIKNFVITTNGNKESVGLFGNIGGKGYQTLDDLVYTSNIKNLILEDVTINIVNTTRYNLNVGILAGKMNTGGVITNIKVKNSSISVSNDLVTSKTLLVGGLIGKIGNNGFTSKGIFIEDIFVEANIETFDSINTYVGGIIGSQDTNTYFTNLTYIGTITTYESGKTYVAALIGLHYAITVVRVTYAKAIAQINTLANDRTEIGGVSTSTNHLKKYYFLDLDISVDIEKTDQSVVVINLVD